MNMQSDIGMACIVVTYNPESNTLSTLISQLLKSPVSIYVIDNWFSEESTRNTSELSLRHPDRIKFFPLEKNFGIAKAINIGVESALKDKHDFAMLLDQDSTPQDGLLKEMQIVAAQLSASSNQVAAIGPRLYDPRSGVFFKFARLKWGIWRKTGCNSGNGDLIPCEFINSSGSLIFLKHWNHIGPFREDFFIDHVETEWYMRVRYLGLKCYGYCSKSYLEHQMGDDVCRYWFWGWRYMPRRPPRRHYTIVRNGIWMWRFRHTPIAWVANSLIKMVFTLIYFSIFDKEGKKQFSFILKGVRDGLLTRPCD